MRAAHSGPCNGSAARERRDSHKNQSLLIAFDQALLVPAGALLQALSERIQPNQIIYALTRNVRASDLLLLERVFGDLDLRFVLMDSYVLPRAKLLKHTSPSTLDRLLIHRTLPPGRFLYIDIDTLPLADPQSIWEGMNGCDLFARPNMNPAWTSPNHVIREHVRAEPELSEIEVLRYFEELMAESTFNAGVLGIDTDSDRVVRALDSAIELVELFGFNDQFALNFAVNGAFCQLEPSWNFWPNQDVAELAPSIIHWVGSRKPWNSRLVPFAGKYKASEVLFRKKFRKIKKDFEEHGW